MTLDRSKVWTGSINEQALEPQSRATVGLYDTTLRDGEQTVGVVLTPEEKLEIARALDAAGIDRIEAGFPRVSAEDFEAVRAIAEAGLRAEVWGFSRAVQADVDALVELGVRASVIESPISDGKLDALGVSRDTMLDRIRSAVSFASDHGIRVAFFGVDSSRADLDFFDRVYAAAVEAGAAEVVVVDTLGIATPEAAAFLVSRTLERVDVPVHWHGHDDFGLGTAAAIAAVQAGATWVQGTVNGMGERAGNADLLEVALALEALYGIPTRLELTHARTLSRLVAEKAGTPLPPWKAVTGDALFTRESGAVAAQFHDPPAIEPYSSELVGAERGVVLGKKSGIDSIRIALARLGLDVPPDRQAELLAEVKRLGTAEQRLVTDDEIAVHGRRAARSRVTIERQAFFEVMASFPSGVAIVTTLDEGGLPRGLTTTAVCSVSANPPTILICVDLGSRTLAALRAGGRFVVNFMGEGRSELCLLFASKAEDKFANISWRPTASGLPLLHEDVVAWAECATAHELEVGDHVLLVGRVEDGGSQPELGRPLMYYRRSWGVWSPVHESEEPDPVSIPAIEVSARDLRWQGAEM